MGWPRSIVCVRVCVSNWDYMRPMPPIMDIIIIMLIIEPMPPESPPPALPPWKFLAAALGTSEP